MFLKIKYTFFCALFLFAWGVVTPHFQIPDEFAHHDRLGSLLSGDLFGSTKAADPKYLNPIAEYSGYNALPFQSSNGMRPLMTSEAKLIQKKIHESDQITIKNCCATNYPPLFYSVISVPSLAAYASEISPFNQYWIIRTTVIVAVSLLWTAAFFIAEKLSLRSLVLVGLTTPMVAFMSTGINPDAIFFPLTVLFILAIVQRINHKSRQNWHYLISAALPLVKIFGLFLILALFFAFTILTLIRKKDFTKIDAMALTMPGLISGSIWYGLTGVVHPSESKSQPIFGLIDLIYYYKNFDWIWLAKSTYGIFGWLDTPLPNYAYLMALVLLSIAFGICISREKKSIKNTSIVIKNITAPILILTALGYGCSIFVVDAYLSRYDGRVIQGRYLLPSFFIFVWFINHYRGWTSVLLGSWVLLSSIGLVTVFDRYYAGNFKVLKMNLPGTKVAVIAPESTGSLPILFSVPNGVKVDHTRGGNIDTISSIGFHDHIVSGWFDATRFPGDLSALVVTSKSTEFVSATARRVARVDLKNLNKELANNGFELKINGFRLSGDLKTKICVYALKDGIAELINNNSGNDPC